MGDRIGALGLVLDALVPFNTRYMDAAVNQLRADGLDVRDEDVTRLSPCARHHINMLRPVLLPAPRAVRGPAPAA
nr:transposase [Streptomyces sp. MMG1121]